MGEIGIKEHDFLYHHTYWQLQAILRGYRKRTHDYQLLLRWQTWAILKGIVGIQAETPQDILSLPCDPHEPHEAPPSEQELQALIAECQEYNRKVDEKNKEK